MPLCQESILSLEAAQGYFAHLNPIAQKIAHDIREAKSAYGKLWYTLSPNDQDDIINGALIKPEISLKYYTTYSSSSTSSSSSSISSSSHLDQICQYPNDASESRSSESLIASMLKNINEVFLVSPSREQRPRTSFTLKVKNITTDMKNCYGYDGRNLRSYMLQKVAMKIINDDTHGSYRDEHSRPFSYRTMSQINLHALTCEVSIPRDFALRHCTEHDDEVCLLSGIEGNENSVNPLSVEKHTAINYQLVQQDLLDNRLVGKSKPVHETGRIGYNRIEDSCIIFPLNKQDANFMPSYTMAATTHKKVENTTANCLSKPLTVYMGSATEAIAYTDAYLKHQEHSNLMEHCGIDSQIIASSSSETTSDDDHEHDDNTLCEDVKLLDDVSLRRGFDFLNNW